MRHMYLHKILAGLIAGFLLLGLMGCGAPAAQSAAAQPTQQPAATAAQEPPRTEAPTPEPTPAPTPEPTVVDIRFTEPEGFTADPENPMKLLAPNYPADPSFIGVSRGERDESVLDYTKESYTAYLTDYYSASFGKPVDIYVDSFYIKEIDGSPGMRATYFLNTDDFFLLVQELIAVADGNYQFLFADATSDNAWMKPFSISARTLDIVWSNETGEPDYSMLPLADPGVGLTIRMSADMRMQKNDSFAMFYTSDSCMMSALRESAEELEAAGVGGADMSLEEYAAVVERNNGLKFSPDSYGHPAAIYTSVADGNSFVYYSTVRKGTDAFWLVSLACLEAEREAWLPQFEFWANSIKVK